jgi:CheY-like chemotaxis protein
MSQLARVLYVEDEPDIQTVARLALEIVGGFTVKVCSSGEEALREAENFAPDMILLDVMMPGLSGPGTLKALRALPTLQKTLVVFMTAKAEPEDLAFYQSLGVRAIISKPFEPMKLSEQMHTIWKTQHD